jgi:protein Tex
MQLAIMFPGRYCDRGMPRDNSLKSMTSSGPRKPQQPSAGGALAEALRRAAEKGGRPKT